jgi:hypothetical protein
MAIDRLPRRRSEAPIPPRILRALHNLHGRLVRLERLQSLDPQVERGLQCLTRLERMFDEFAGAYLDAKFPYGDGKGPDRWRRRR